MTDGEQQQVPTKDRRRQPTQRELKATITVNDGDLHGLLTQLQQSIIEATAAKIATIKTPEVSVPKVLSSPAVVDKTVGGVNLAEAERLKAANLRTGLLLGKVPDTAGLLIDTKTMAKLLSVSTRTIMRLDDENAIPQPVRIGGKFIRWRLAELLAWMDGGCPLRRNWKYPDETMRMKPGR